VKLVADRLRAFSMFSSSCAPGLRGRGLPVLPEDHMNGAGSADWLLWAIAMVLLACLITVIAAAVTVILIAKWAIARANEKDIPRTIRSLAHFVSKANWVADLAAVVKHIAAMLGAGATQDRPGNHEAADRFLPGASEVDVAAPRTDTAPNGSSADGSPLNPGKG
jgi:hypothetical protein